MEARIDRAVSALRKRCQEPFPPEDGRRSARLEKVPDTFSVVTTLIVFLAQLVVGLSAARAADYRTTNFVVSAPSPQLAQEIGLTAERCRKELATEWTGKEMPPWSGPCPIHARVAPNLGAGGATSFVFDRGEVFGWRMNIQGSRERILDSVLPHEVTHTIFASHFRQPLPRWADEGACTSVEHRTEVAKQERMLINFLKSRRALPFSQMFAMKDYPEDVMPLYAQGHSVAQWLIESRGRKEFLDFLADGMQDDNWPRAVHQHYGFDNLYAMQNGWLDWVREGRPHLTPESSPIAQLVSHTRRSSTPAGDIGKPAIYRGQSPDAGNGRPPLEPLAPIASVPIPATAASGSVYAAAAARARRDRAAAGVSPPADDSRPIYDASRSMGILRR